MKSKNRDFFRFNPLIGERIIAPNLPLSRWIIALLIAIASDVASLLLSLTVFLQIGLDICTALILLAVFGWRWALFIALVLEAIPVVSMFPTWTLMIIAMMVSGMLSRNQNRAQNKELHNVV
jgi:hypothetical protein